MQSSLTTAATIALAAMVAISGAEVTGCSPAGANGSPAQPVIRSSSPAMSSHPARRNSPAARARKTKPPPTTAAGWDRRACQDFQTFYLDLQEDTPHAFNILIPAAQKVLSDVINAGTYGSRRVYYDANDLVAYVGSSAWAYHGNVFSAPVQHMVTACSRR